MYPTILLRLSVEILDHIVTFTWCLLNYILNQSYNTLSLIISNCCICSDSLNSCLWRIIETIYFVSLSFDMIVGVCTFSLSFCTTVSVFRVSLYFFNIDGDHLHVWLSVTILLNCDFSNRYGFWGRKKGWTSCFVWSTRIWWKIMIL